MKMKYEIPFWEKANLTIEEAAAYFNIGTTKLRELTGRADCPFALWIGRKCLIKKDVFKEYLQKRYSV